ncbi:hypothetical protein CAPTEDRAFT_201411 [Capitella teleta]|uniref:HAT C-terminal dimerisation domain-containing protein n=1 Tax=Capitella teleta TaxID=283909 RepID=R7THJ4_CAPTE|nr:hypothetical protein CAPTEDRAFT_201411 [Capitella teleta]|eukprot:ELT93189.1 hypothetical protein CAPTEDRAFT_201411 [Capitella teleta]
MNAEIARLLNSNSEDWQKAIDSIHEYWFDNDGNLGPDSDDDLTDDLGNDGVENPPESDDEVDRPPNNDNKTQDDFSPVTVSTTKKGLATKLFSLDKLATMKMNFAALPLRDRKMLLFWENCMWNQSLGNDRKLQKKRADRLHFSTRAKLCALKLSCLFIAQKTTSTIAYVFDTLKHVTAAIANFEERQTPAEKEIKNHIFKGEPLAPGQPMTTDRARVICSLQQELQKRFDSDSTVLKATSILSLREWPTEEEKLAEFGDAEIQLLCQHFDQMLQKAEVDSTSIPIEWCLLKKKVAANGINDWASVAKKYKDDHPNLISLIDLLLSLPASSAEAERVFSSLKQVKSDIHSKLMDSSVSDLLTIQLISPAIKDFNPTEAIHLWNNPSRRPNTKPYGPRAKAEDKDADSETDSSDIEDIEMMEMEADDSDTIDDCQ